MPDPVFVADRATLLTRLRLADGCGPDGLIDQAIEEARVWLYNDEVGLGKSLVDQILLTPYVDNASTMAELRRTCANLLEVKVVRRRLLCTMPVLFMDAGGVRQEAWNEEPFFRGSRDDAAGMIEKLDAEIQNKLREIKGDSEDIGKLQAMAFEPECPGPTPGGSLRTRVPRVNL